MQARRPRTTWMDNKTWTGLPVEESIRMTEDRDKWRKYVHGVANTRIEDSYRSEQTLFEIKWCDREVIEIWQSCHCLYNIRNMFCTQSCVQTLRSTFKLL